MTSLTLAVVLQAAVLATGGNTYSDAHKQSAETGRPIMILIGADWCPACQTMKNSAMPEVRRRGLLKKVEFAVINTDQEKALARQMMAGGSIPQLVMYRKTASGWKRKILTGAQSPENIEAFINSTVEAQAASNAEDRGRAVAAHASSSTDG